MSIEWIRHVQALAAEAAAAREAAARGEHVPLPPHLQPVAAEIETFYRELPRLLEEGEGGRCAVIRGNQVESVWDTPRDAKQHGYRVFDDGRFLAGLIDARWLDALAPYFGTVAESK
jgi:hypothetical protein